MNSVAAIGSVDVIVLAVVTESSRVMFDVTAVPVAEYQAKCPPVPELTVPDPPPPVVGVVHAQVVVALTYCRTCPLVQLVVNPRVVPDTARPPLAVAPVIVPAAGVAQPHEVVATV